MNLSKTPSSNADADVWAQRRRNNVRLGWALGAVAVAIFLIAILKYRPL
jgi:hypothetical protein